METITQFKTVDPFKNILKNFNLTEANLLKVKNKKKIGDNYSVHLLLSDLLEEHGIYLFGGTNLMDLNRNQTETFVGAITLHPEFPVENISIIDQLYGYENTIVNITLRRSESCEYAFLYNTSDKSCTLMKWIWGSIEKETPYACIEDLLSDVNSTDDIENLFLSHE